MTVSAQTFFLAPLAVHLLVLALVALRYRKRGTHNLSPPKARIFRCSNCRHIYIDNRRVPLSKCTKCNTLNEMIRR